MNELKEFNLNEYIHVKLTDVGREELERQHNELNDTIPNYTSEHPYSPPKEDEDGFSKFQGWILMSSLGHLMRMGCRPPFETTIKIELRSSSK